MFIASSDPLGVISQSSFWSSARSGGQQGLGIVADPNEINRTIAGTGAHAGLGVVPNDFQLAYHRPYLPVMHGWVETKQGDLGEGEAATSEPRSLQSKLAIISTGAVAVIAVFSVLSFLRS